jgi:hypothetical protein
MSVTQIKQAIGEWSLSLRPDTPRAVLDALTYYGHIAILPGGAATPEQYGDNLLLASRYVGVYRGRDSNNEFVLHGGGMALWLGDEDDKGDVFETAVTFTGATFASTIAGLLPPGGAITAGTIGAIAGTYTGKHQWQTPRAAIQYVTDTFSSPASPAEWRVTNDGKLDANLVSVLYVTSPRAILMRRQTGKDLTHVAVPGNMALGTKVDDFTTRVVLLAEGEGDSIATGSADIAVNPYKDIHGNAAKLTRLASEAETSPANAAARAALMLNRFSNPANAVELSTANYDVNTDFVVGDYIYVYDPDSGFVDAANEEFWNGERINPVKIRCVEMTWPILAGWTVAFRDSNGNWIDLSPWYEPETGDTTIVVGDLPSDLTGIGGGIDIRPDIGSDSTIPAAPTFNTPFQSVAYQSSTLSDYKAAVLITWNEPLNLDGSTITDGAYYEIAYRAVQTFKYSVLWSQIMLEHYNELATWARPLDNPAAVANEWNYVQVGWDFNQFMINELLVAAQYEFQIRAVDSANPPHASAWSASQLFTTKSDVIAPAQPAPPVVHSSPIAIQVVHSLGASTGGTFNLANDLHHLEVHIGGGDFFPDSTTIVGQIIANEGNLIGKIAVVATFQVPYTEAMTVKVIAVDRFGNKSSPSAGATATPDLINDQFISSLTASKITAGTISSDVLLSGSIKTAEAGQRAELNALGLQLYDADGNLTVNLTADDANPNFIAILDDNGNTVSSMDSLGNISGSVITAAQDVIIAGNSFIDDYYDPLPKGIVAYGSVPVLTATITGAGANTEMGAFEISFVADATRRYEICCNAQMQTNWAGTPTSEQFTYRLRDGGDQPPTIASPSLYRHEWFGPQGTSSGFSNGVLLWQGTLSSGLHRLLWTFMARYGNGFMNFGNQGAVFKVEDIGSSEIDDTMLLNDGGVVTAAPPPAVATYTKTYKATWSGSYDGSGSYVSYYGTEAHQGYYSGAGNGNQRSLIGFNSSQIKSDLSGATIKSVKLTAYAEHWYYNDGGTAVIGTHNYTGRPSSWSSGHVNDNRQQSTGWPKPGKRTVTLTSGFGTDLKSGAATGIAFGPGPTTDVRYYGRFTGWDGGSNAPYLTITYTK